MENLSSYEEGNGNFFQNLRFCEEGNYFQDFRRRSTLLQSAFLYWYYHTEQLLASADELDVLFEGDILRFWADMEEDAYHKTKKADSEKELNLGCDTVEKATKMQGRPSNGPEKKPLTFELVSQYFCMPIKQAAQELNVGLTLLKKRCRDLGISRWPHRKVKSLQTLIKNIQELGKETGVDEDWTRIVIEMLQQTKKLMEERPDVMLDEKTKILRQACFKENFKRRKLMALG